MVALSRHRAPCRPGVVDWHLDVQHVMVAGGADPAPGPLAYVSPESRQVAWWPVDELPPGLAPGVDGLVRRAVAVLDRHHREGEPQEAGSR